jgi:hypothetical protein
MPRTAENSSSLIAAMTAHLERLVAAARAEGRDAALAEVRGLIGGGSGTPVIAGGAKRRGRPRGSKNKPRSAAARPAKGAKPRKSSWAGLSPEARLARINAIRQGRGLAPKSSL